jgi:hypothetical protein
MKILHRAGFAVLLPLFFCLVGSGAAGAAPAPRLGDPGLIEVQRTAGPIVPPSRLICDGSRRVCVRWRNIPGGMACSRWELRFYGCRARRSRV